jgi:hypothetical protein
MGPREVRPRPVRRVKHDKAAVEGGVRQQGTGQRGNLVGGRLAKGSLQRLRVETQHLRRDALDERVGAGGLDVFTRQKPRRLATVLPTFLVVRAGGSVYWAWWFATAHIFAMAACFYLRFRTGKWKEMRVIEPEMETSA